MASENNILVKEVYSKVSTSMQSNLPKIKKMLAAFMEERSTDMYDIAPFSRINFDQRDVDAFYSSTGLVESQIMESIKKTFYGTKPNFNPRAAQDPLTVAILMCVRYFILKKDTTNTNLFSVYLAFSGKFYPSVHYGSFPKVQPSEYRHVMEYAVHNMMTDKFEIKRDGTVFGSISNICKRWISTYSSRFKTMSDQDVVYLIQQLRSRIASFMQNIAEVYYEAYNNKDSYLSYDSDNYDEESYRLADNNSFKADRCVESAMNAITTRGVSYDICVSASNSSVDAKEVKSIMESIQSDPVNLALVRELITIMVYEYMQGSSTKEVTGVDFLIFAVSSKPNTKNNNLNRMKEIVVKLLDENSSRYLKRKNREGTANNYQKCVMTYYAMMVNKYNK